MEKEHELTEKLKVLENEVYDAKEDLRTISSKLDMAYSYEHELVQRQVAAKEKTEKLRQEFFKKTGEISTLYKKMKAILDIFTGNFYND